MEGGTQVLMSTVAIGLAAILYELGKNHQKQLQYDPTKDSIKDVWGSDPIIADRHAQAQMLNQKYPSCQVWDETYQVFMDTGDKNADGSEDKCFVNYGAGAANGKVLNARYLSQDRGVAIITYARENPIDEPPEEEGTCWFQQGSDWFSFPATVMDVVPPPNRSSRLCFGAGETAESQGRFFQRTSDNAIFMAPTTLPGPTPRCETTTSIPLTSALLPKNLPPFVGGPNMSIHAWSHDTGNTDQTTCLAGVGDSSGTSKRYVTDTSIIFTNPMTKTVEEMPNVPY